MLGLVRWHNHAYNLELDSKEPDFVGFANQFEYIGLWEKIGFFFFRLRL